MTKKPDSRRKLRSSRYHLRQAPLNRSCEAGKEDFFMPLAARQALDLRHVVESQQFDRPLLERVFGLAAEMEMLVAAGGSEELKGRIRASLFYEPSTRTRLSF